VWLISLEYLGIVPAAIDESGGRESCLHRACAQGGAGGPQEEGHIAQPSALSMKDSKGNGTEDGRASRRIVMSVVNAPYGGDGGQIS